MSPSCKRGNLKLLIPIATNNFLTSRMAKGGHHYLNVQVLSILSESISQESFAAFKSFVSTVKE